MKIYNEKSGWLGEIQVVGPRIEKLSKKLKPLFFAILMATSPFITNAQTNNGDLNNKELITEFENWSMEIDSLINKMLINLEKDADYCIKRFPHVIWKTSTIEKDGFKITIVHEFDIDVDVVKDIKNLIYYIKSKLNEINFVDTDDNIEKTKIKELVVDYLNQIDDLVGRLRKRINVILDMDPWLKRI